MIELPLQRVMPADEALDLWRDTYAPAVPPLVITEPTVLTLDGAPVAAVGFLSPAHRAELRQAALNYVHEASEVYRSQGIMNAARVFGYLSRQPMLKRMACSACSGAASWPVDHAQIAALAEILAEQLRGLVPEAAAALSEQVTAGVHPDWLLPGGFWTSGVVNKTSQLPYHRDRNNFDVWSAMPTLRRGVDGGHLHLPELETLDGKPVVFPCGDGHIQFFNGQEYMHGVTPLHRRQPDGYRISVVYYPIKKMHNCLPAADELLHAQRARTVNDATLLERQSAAGLLASEHTTLGVHDD